MQLPTKSTIAEELKRVSEQRARIQADEERDPKNPALRELKKNYAEELSRHLAQRFANLLRASFPGILPDEAGRGQESLARASKKPKRLDVNYSNPLIGLGLGLSIKTINFRDHSSQRYTKNFTRVDNEWRAEASDYHERQPYAVMIGILFLPADAVSDMKQTHSSLAQAVNVFRHRTARKNVRNHAELFEKIYIGLYHSCPQTSGDVAFFDVESAPPRAGYPSKTLTIGELIREICRTYDDRNNIVIEWEGEVVTSEPASIETIQELQAEQEDDEEIF